ncbi:protein phosphatase [Alteromonadaceae bacterium Bs31]|nr:protein phosphatase [Alteromonadaceae bacterium Bs31]
MSNTEFRPIDWIGASATDVGTVREVNEDAVILRPEIGMWAVADGMGGHEVGDIASAKVVEALAGVENHELLSDIVDAIDDALISANEGILEYSREQLDNASMGSTLVSLIVRGRVGICIWVGDSRLYRLRGGVLTQLSRDHSQVEEMLQMGLLTPEQAENHPDSHVITRAIGGEDELFIDINIFSLQIGDSFLLCSDGLYNAVNIEDMEQNLLLRNPQQVCDQLLTLALENSARDNVSLIVIKGEAGKL